MSRRGDMTSLLLLAIFYGGWLIPLIRGEAILPDFSSCVTVEDICPNGNISYWLYTKALEENPYLIDVNDDQSMKNAPLVPGAQVKVIIHGYTGFRDYSPNMELRPAYFQKGDYNLISLDYGPLVKAPCYLYAANSVDTVGKCTSQFIIKMMNLVPSVFNLDNLHVIGFSLGAHVAGAVGKYMAQANQTLNRVTGLDPALPLFDPYTTSADKRLDASKAKFVDVAHSNAGNKGLVSPVGTVDFYLNLGYDQPGCKSNASCDHVRAVEVYAESINSKTGFYGAPCNVGHFLTSYISGVICPASNPESPTELFGEYVSTSARGTFQVITGSLQNRQRLMKRTKRDASGKWKGFFKLFSKLIELAYFGFLFVSPAAIYGKEGIAPPYPNPNEDI